MIQSFTKGRRFLLTLLCSSLLSLILLEISNLIGGNFAYGYLIKNLFLAWIPLILSLWLVFILEKNSWTSYPALIISLLWLLFLPNAFYMITDFIHIQDIQSSLAVYYAISLASIIINAVLVGYVSLFIVYGELSKRISVRKSLLICLLIILLSSFAVYIGRDLRWNSWDVFINPAGVLFDLTQKLITFKDYPSIFGISGVLFLFLASIFLLLKNAVDYIKKID